MRGEKQEGEKDKKPEKGGAYTHTCTHTCVRERERERERAGRIEKAQRECRHIIYIYIYIYIYTHTHTRKRTCVRESGRKNIEKRKERERE